MKRRQRQKLKDPKPKDVLCEGEAVHVYFSDNEDLGAVQVCKYYISVTNYVIAKSFSVFELQRVRHALDV